MANIPAGFVEAVGPDGQKRIVPRHYLTNKTMGEWRLPASQRVTEPAADTNNATTTDEPATADTTDTKSKGARR